MMSQQARILHPERFALPATFRNYASDSPEAKARLAILALLVDGEIDECELLALQHPHIRQTLGIGGEAFAKVLHELCEDMAKLPRHDGAFSISGPQLSGLFAAVREPGERDKLLRMIAALIRCDGHVSGQEAWYWKCAARAWRRPEAMA